MEIQQVHVARYESGEQRVITTEEMAAFQSDAPYGYTLSAASALLVNGTWYVLASPTPVEPWTLAAYEKGEKERDEAIAGLPQAQRDVLFPGHLTLEERRAKRAAEDAEAEARAAALREQG